MGGQVLWQRPSFQRGNTSFKEQATQCLYHGNALTESSVKTQLPCDARHWGKKQPITYFLDEIVTDLISDLSSHTSQCDQWVYPQCVCVCLRVYPSVCVGDPLQGASQPNTSEVRASLAGGYCSFRHTETPACRPACRLHVHTHTHIHASLRSQTNRNDEIPAPRWLG